MANRLAQLQQLANHAPELESRALASGKAARTALLQQQLGALPAPNLQQAQELQAQQATIAGQQQLEAAKQSQQAAAELGKEVVQTTQSQQSAGLQQAAMGLEERQQLAKDQMATRLQKDALESRKRVTQADIDAAKLLQARGFEVDSKMQFASDRQRQDLARIGNNVKQELLDSRIAFDKDEAGRKFSNTRQLADFAVAESKTQQEFEARMNSIANAAQTNAIVTDALNNRLTAILTRGYIEREGDLDAAQQVRLQSMAAETRKAAARAKSEAGNKALMGQAIGTVVGTGLGAYFGGPAGAAAGASLGGAAGTLASTNS